MPDASSQVKESDLKNWKMLQCFEEAVEKVFGTAKLHPTFADPRRELDCQSYLSLFFFGLANPVIESMRGLCSISQLERVQKEVCHQPVSPGNFSAVQHVLDVTLLRQVFTEVRDQTVSRAPLSGPLTTLNLIAQDGTLLSALARMGWAEYGGGRAGTAKAVRLHLRFNVCEDKPVDLLVTPGKTCERQALREMCQPGQTNVGDRYYGEDYQLFGEIDAANAYFVFRLKADAVIQAEEELPVSEEDRAAGVVRHAWVRLGGRASNRSMRLRLVEIKTAAQHLLLVTNLSVERASAALVGTIYRRRWSIELFFRWIKCVLGCRHFFAESPAGVEIQLYLVMIAALLFQRYSGRRPSKRAMEMIQMYLLGWATAEELAQLFQNELASEQKHKKS